MIDAKEYKAIMEKEGVEFKSLSGLDEEGIYYAYIDNFVCFVRFYETSEPVMFFNKETDWKVATPDPWCLAQLHYNNNLCDCCGQFKEHLHYKYYKEPDQKICPECLTDIFEHGRL